MLKGGYTFGAFGIHSPPFRTDKCWQTIQKQLDYFHELINEDDRIILAKEPADIRNAFKQGKLAGFPVIEGCIVWANRENIPANNDSTELLIFLINLACAISP